MTSLFHQFCYQATKSESTQLGKPKPNQDQFFLQPNFSHLILHTLVTIPDGDQAQEDMEANQQDQEEVEAQMEDAHGDQSPPQRLTRSMFKALGARGRLFTLFVISLVEGA